MVSKEYVTALNLICASQFTKGRTLAVMECTRKRDGAIVNLLVIIEDNGGGNVLVRPMAEMISPSTSVDDYLPPTDNMVPERKPGSLEN